ncbi:MAG: FAD-dependent oxidoreductase, partial [Bacteroidota bacterium]
HKVRDIRRSADGKSIGRITIGRQATPKNGAYAPLVDVRGLACWPSYPLFDQLEEGETLKAQGIDLESGWNDWKDVDTFELEHGKDFDHVILGIPVAALPEICSDIIDHDQRWADMVQKVTTTPTVAAQLWLKPNLNGLGWPHPHLGRAISGTYELPYETNADLSNLLCRERWPDHEYPQHVAYLCGKLDVEDYAPYSDTEFPERALDRVRAYTLDYVHRLAPELWPRAFADGEFQWHLLADLQGRKGEDRLESQYMRANIDPTERYVLSEAGNSAYRLKADASGYANLTLTGDWIDTGFNAGCIEAAVMSGKQAARAVTGSPIRIPGEHILPGMPAPVKRKTKKSVQRATAATLFKFYQSLTQ